MAAWPAAVLWKLSWAVAPPREVGEPTSLRACCQATQRKNLELFITLPRLSPHAFLWLLPSIICIYKPKASESLKHLWSCKYVTEVSPMAFIQMDTIRAFNILYLKEYHEWVVVMGMDLEEKSLSLKLCLIFSLLFILLPLSTTTKLHSVSVMLVQ